MRRLILLAAIMGIITPTFFLVACATDEPVADSQAEAVEEQEDVQADVREDTQEDVQEAAGAADSSSADDSGDCVPIELEFVDPLEVTGSIAAAGSSTVYPLSEAIAEMFEKDGYSGQISIDSIGSGAGFERFCTSGETDISNASRPIKAKEAENCRDIGREPLEFKLATDAIAVVVSTENDFVTDVTIDELALIFSAAQTWADVRPDWPEEEILRFAPGTDSGTFDFFVEEVFDEDPEPHLSAVNLQQSEDDNVLVQGVQGSPYAVAYFGYAYYDQNRDSLIALGLDGVEATAESVDAGEYALARPLYNYTTAEILTEKPQVADFLSYYLSNVDYAVESVGYFPASCEAMNESKTLLLEATGQ